MKKFLAMLLVAAMVFSMAACAKAPEAAQPAATEETAGETAETAEAPKDGKVYKVAMICDSSISDGGWGMSCYNAMMDAAEKHGWETAVSDSIEQSAYFDTIDSYCTLGYDMIYAPGNQYTDAVLQAAAEYPDIAFALLNGAADTPAKAENGTTAFIGGMELDTTKGKYEGYKEAAAYVAEKAGKTATTLDIVYSNSFSASDKGIEFAKAMIDKGADVFFGDASAVDSGARQAIDEYNAAQGSVKVFDIAQPADLLGQNECIICSQVTDNSAMVGSCMEAVEAGKLGGDVIYGTLENGALSAGAVSDLVPAEIKDQYNAYIEEMKAGTFMK